MKLQILIAIGVMQCACLVGVAQANGAPEPDRTKRSSTPPQKSANHAVPEEQGERKFRENCSRCHNAPEELPVRVTGTVLLHMRVRASLSEADERAILRYLAP